MPAQRPFSSAATGVQGSGDPFSSIDNLGRALSGDFSKLTSAINRTIEAVGRAGDNAVKAADALTRKVADANARIERVIRS